MAKGAEAARNAHAPLSPEAVKWVLRPAAQSTKTGSTPRIGTKGGWASRLLALRFSSSGVRLHGHSEFPKRRGAEALPHVRSNAKWGSARILGARGTGAIRVALAAARRVCHRPAPRAGRQSCGAHPVA